MEKNKFLICRQNRECGRGFDYLGGFTSDGLFHFTEKWECACLIPAAMLSTALLWCELWNTGDFFFAMILEG